MSKGNPKSSSKGSTAFIRARQNEMVGVVFLLTSTLLLLSLVSYNPNDPIFNGANHKADNLIGIVGAYLADGHLYALGLASFLLVAAFFYGAVMTFIRGGFPLPLKKVAGYVTLTVLGTILCHIAFKGEQLLGHAPGGLVGEYTGGLFVSLLSSTGAVVVAIAGMLLCLLSITELSLIRTSKLVAKGLSWVGEKTAKGVSVIAVYVGKKLWELLGWAWQKSRTEIRELIQSMNESPEQPKEKSSGRKSKQKAVAIEPAFLDEPLLSTEPPVTDEDVLHNPVVVEPVENFLSPPAPSPVESMFREPVVVTAEPSCPPPLEPVKLEKPSKPSFRTIKRDLEPEIVIPKPQEKEDSKVMEESAPPPAFNPRDYKLPELALLESKEQVQTVIEKEKLQEYAHRLEEKLADYGVEGRVTKIMPGPVVTMYEYAPAPGVKVSKISGLSNDLALALEAMSVRIVAPIPGRAVVGIEVANKERQTVYSKEIIGHSSFQRSRSMLTLALGKDIEGTPYITDLNKMPHLLVAGATGTGKSVALNTMITSILYKATPEDVRFIMIDPKVLELSLYEGIPHLLLPVVTDPRKAQVALNWTVTEMERRIQLLHIAGVRSLDSYNKKIEKGESLDADQPESSPVEALGTSKKKKVIVIDNTASLAGAAPPENQDSVAQESQEASPPLENPVIEEPEEPKEPEKPAGTKSQDEAPERLLEKLPHIVIVIDELADLMMTSSREVESSICRIAQKARAAGIHLLIATQRPSVNVITGLIKANLPARISFRVASKTDSRTILDQNGAETLLGNGDMLFHPPTSSEISRIHGALITEDEITRIVKHLKDQAQPVYDDTILAAAEEEEEAEFAEDEDQDDLYDMAVQIVAQMGQASTSMIQRKLRIGYNRAARLIERMEREGIVGPADGAKPREVLVQDLAP